MKNKIQFQKGISLIDFLKQYGSEQQCRDAVFKLKWSNGFQCPNCGHNEYCEIKSRKCFQCNRCHHQTSLLVGTIYQQTKLPLTVWFLASYLLTESKAGISAMNLYRKLGVSYNTALIIKHKLMQVMLEGERNDPLSGRIEADDAYLGGELSNNKRGRGSPNKTPFIAAVETTEDRHPLKIKLHKLHAFKKDEIEAWSRQNLTSGSHIVTDGLRCFNGFDKAGFEHQIIVTGGGSKSAKIPEFLWVNTVLGNVKTAIQGSYHAINPKHLPRYLAEFEYRFNRRFNLASLPSKLIADSVRTPPMPCRLLKLAEAYW